jgi:hypothetical protein
MDTNALIAFYDDLTDLPREDLEKAIPAAIDALYATRDTNGGMHDAGAAAAVAALQASSYRQYAEYARMGWTLVALPPEIAGDVVGSPATREMAMALSHRLSAAMDA